MDYALPRATDCRHRGASLVDGALTSDAGGICGSGRGTCHTGHYACVTLVDGSVSGLELIDFNRDGRPDVMQLHRDTSEFSVRLTGALRVW
jgi:hypothetical protein